jgi:hypothetical protein
MIARFLVFILSFFLFAQETYAQAPVIQSGSVTQGHLPWWVTDGVIGDAGTANNNTVTSLGATGQGPIICANSAAISVPRNQVCIGSDSNSGYIYFNTPNNPPSLLVSINGSPTPFLVQQGSITPGDATCWVSTGIIKDCGPSTGVIQQGVVTANDFTCWAGNGIIKDCGTQSFVTQTGAVTATHAACWSSNGIIDDCGAPPAFVSGTPGTGDPACWANATTLQDCGVTAFVSMSPQTFTAGHPACWVSVNVIQDCGSIFLTANGTQTAGRPTCWIGSLVFQLQTCSSIFLVSSGSFTAGDVACWTSTAGTTLRDCGLTIIAGSGTITSGNMACWNGGGTIPNTGVFFIQDCGSAPGRTNATIGNINGTYTIATTDCGKSFQAFNGYYNILFNPGSTYPPGCIITITNVEPLGGSGKRIIVSTDMTNAGFGFNGCGTGGLCPGQTVQYQNLGPWRLTQNPGPWRPQQAVSWHASPGASNFNDCLSASTPCDLAFLCSERMALDTGAMPTPALFIYMASGLYSSVAGGYACFISGNQGSSAPLLTQLFPEPGANVTIQAAGSGIGIYAKDGGEVDVNGTNSGGSVSFYGDNSSIGIAAAQFAIVDIFAGLIFGNQSNTGTTTGISIQATQMASINLGVEQTAGQSMTINTTGNCPNQGSFIATDSGAWVTESSATAGHLIILVQCAANYNTGFYNVQGGNLNNLNGIQYGGTSLGSVTSPRIAYYGGTTGTSGTGHGGCVYISPPTGGITLDTLGTPGIAVALPVGACVDFSVQTSVALLPGCSADSAGRQFFVTNNNSNVWGTNVAIGPPNNLVLVGCDGANGAFTVIGK